MILNMVLWSFITLTSIILLIFFIPYRLAVTGHVQWQERKKSGNATINFGGAHRGITISPFPTIKIGFGEFDHPIFSFSLPKKKESPVKKENSKKQKSKTKKKIPYFKIGESTMGEIHFDQFYLNGDIGLPNPMHTGIIYGWSQ
ncbi:MAG: hypothetical protein HOH55_09535, partial [Candidatus Marinimicrobia bacterium]|nr:hypothetical protein [Candidatus Neomarinimicrobiota bacterium]